MTKKQKNLGLKPVKCHECKETKELGIDAFWCPRLVNLSFDFTGVRTYGDFVCLNCCKDMFYDSIHSINLRGSCGGSCYSCDFPIGAVLDIKNNWIEKLPEKPYYITEHKTKDEKKRFYMVDLLHRSFFDRTYPNFEWDKEKRMLKIVSRGFCHSSVEELVLDKKKLPVRIIITLDEIVNCLPLDWCNYTKYYWSACNSEQYFKEEKWMDKAPVIISYGLINSDGEMVFDKKVKQILQTIKDKLKIKDTEK